jgi:CHAT domain-containing protein
MELRGVELVVLSACDTGLGRVAGGEGVLGLQRAFQVAGARTTVTSLWKVSDRETQQLMSRFYENLWDKKLSKVEALRQAQLWMLREGNVRGLDLPADNRTLPPRYWAAFVLSGDWR